MLVLFPFFVCWTIFGIVKFVKVSNGELACEMQNSEEASSQTMSAETEEALMDDTVLDGEQSTLNKVKEELIN